MRKNILILFTGILVGSLLATPVFAETNLFQMALSQVKLVINGADKTPSGGTYWNGEANVPLAFQYEGTTYMPLRYISESLGQPVDWDGSTRTIMVGNKTTNASMTLPFGQSRQAENGSRVTLTPMNSVLYDADDANLIKVNVAVRNDDTKPFSFNLYQSQFVSSDGTQFPGSLYIPQNEQNYEIPAKTTQIVQYYADIPKKVSANDLTLMLSKADFSTYPATIKPWAAIPIQVQDQTDPGYLGGHLPVTLDAYPFQMQVSKSVMQSFNLQNQQQDYLVNVAISKDEDVNTFSNAVGITFELIDGDGKTMSEARYALGASSDPNVPVLDSGDQYITFKNVDWNRFKITDRKVRVWETFGSGKRLLGTF